MELKMIKLDLIVVLVALLYSSNLFASDVVKDHTTSGEAGFVAVGKPGFLRINGEGGLVKGIVKKVGTSISLVEMSVNLDSLKTGLDLRDSHMKEKYLETNKFPDAVFSAVNLQLTCPDVSETVQGNLTLHGVTKPVSAAVKGTCDETKIAGEADFDIILGDFAIDIPSFAGVTVAEKVKIHVKFNGSGK